MNVVSLLISSPNFSTNLLKQPENRSLRIQSSIFVVWEQVLDASAKANIQHAATKITNIEDWILRLRLFSLINSYLISLLPFFHRYKEHS